MLWDKLPQWNILVGFSSIVFLSPVLPPPPPPPPNPFEGRKNVCTSISSLQLIKVSTASASNDFDFALFISWREPSLRRKQRKTPASSCGLSLGRRVVGAWSMPSHAWQTNNCSYSFRLSIALSVKLVRPRKCNRLVTRHVLHELPHFRAQLPCPAPESCCTVIKTQFRFPPRETVDR